MDFTRRETLALGAGAVALTVLPFRVNAAAEDGYGDRQHAAVSHTQTL